MVLDITLISLTIITLIIASYTDLKTREVPDWLNYGFLFAVLGIRTLFSLQLGWQILIEGLIGFAIFFLLAHLFYYTNQWGGGDSKLLMGMGAVLGFNLPLNGSSFTIFWFLLSLLFLGSIYGLGWMIFVAVKNKDSFVKEFVTKFNKKRKTNFMIITGTLTALVLGLLVNSTFILFLFLSAVYYLLLFVNSVEKSCFIKNLKIEKLTEGDWLAENVFVKNEKVMEKKTLQRVDIHRLSLLKKDKKLDYVKVKEGVPFVPSFLFAYLAIVFGGKFFVFLSKLVLGY